MWKQNEEVSFESLNKRNEVNESFFIHPNISFIDEQDTESGWINHLLT